jgi:TolB protein
MFYLNKHYTRCGYDNKMKKKLLSLSLTLLFLTVTLSHIPPTHAVLNGTEQQITTDLNSQFDPAIDGDYIVYTDTRAGNMDVYLHNLATGEEMPIADTSEDEFLNDVSGDYVVYTLATFDDEDIFVYSIQTGVTTQITDLENREFALRRDPEVSGNNVVWQDNRNGHWDIFLYNVETATETVVSTGEDPSYPAVGDQVHPAIHENLVVWEDHRVPDDPGIYVCDISDPEPVLIPTDEPGNPYLQEYPDVWGRYVVFDEASPSDLGNRDVILWDLDTNTGVNLTPDSTASQERARIDGGRVVWEDGRNGNIDIYCYDILTESVDPVTTDPNMQFLNDISGNRIVWTDLRNKSPEHPGNYDIYMFQLVACVPDIDLSPTSLSFGNVEIGESSMLIATVSNEGNCPMEVTVVYGGGAEWMDFTFTPDAATVDPGAYIDLLVTYTPPDVGLSEAFLNVSSNDPDEPTVLLMLTGNGVPAAIPPEQIFQDLLDFYDENIDDGDLQGIGPGNSAENREHAIRNMIIAANDLYADGVIEEACDQLWDIYMKIDGESPPASPPDFIEGNAAEEFQQRVLELLDAIGCNT